MSRKEKSYSVELKYQAVGDYLSGKGSLREICKKYGIRDKHTLQEWIKLYNGHKELKCHTGGSRMTKGRKTTYEERIAFVKECIENGYNYTEISEKYKVGYLTECTSMRHFVLSGGDFFVFGGFFSEPIAMCKILLYVESTEIHIAGENYMKRLAWLSVEDYAATQMELVVVSAMKGYLRRMPEKEALKKVETILDPKVICLAGDDGAPMPVQSNVDGAKFAAFIDAAVADSIRELEKREDDLSKAGVTMLGNVDGKSMVEQMSPEFLEFVLDAYRGLKYTQ